MFMRDHEDDNQKRYNSYLYNQFSYDIQFPDQLPVIYSYGT